MPGTAEDEVDAAPATHLAGEPANEDLVSFRQQVRGAWIESSMEFDRTLVLLASGGLALVASWEKVATGWERMLIVVSSLMFLISVSSCLVAFRKNRPYLEALHNDDEDSAASLRTVLGRWDRVAVVSFIVGGASLFALGLTRTVF